MQDLTPRLIPAAEMISEMLSLTFQGFMKHRPGPLVQSVQIANRLTFTFREIRAALTVAQNPRGLNQAVMLEKTRDSILKLSSVVELKVKEGVLYSEKAVTELKDLFEATESLLKHCRDLLLTQNTVIRDYMICRCGELEELIRRCATEHEERLIKGVCLPRSSTLFLFMLDAISDAVWSLDQLAREA